LGSKRGQGKRKLNTMTANKKIPNGWSRPEIALDITRGKTGNLIKGMERHQNRKPGDSGGVYTKKRPVGDSGKHGVESVRRKGNKYKTVAEQQQVKT